MTNEQRAKYLANNYASEERMHLETAILEALDQVERKANAKLQERVKDLEEAIMPFAKTGKDRKLSLDDGTIWNFSFQGKDFAKAAACVANGNSERV